jgi:hypothetical protein
MSMTYRWRYLDSGGGPAPGPDVTFSDQADAEQWLGREWETLLDRGVEAVSLLAGDSVMYGPMDLQP